METHRPEVKIHSKVPLFPSSRLGPYRRADYMALPDEPRCELIYGRFYLLATPRNLHQIAAMVLARWLDDVALEHGGQVVGPADVTLAEHSVVQPDLSYLARRFTQEEIDGWIEGIPDLVIEVLSPSGVHRDRKLKLRLYAETGVPEYWINDPWHRRFDFMINRHGRFEAVLPQGGIYRSPRSPRCGELTFDLTDFWRQVDRRIAH